MNFIKKFKYVLVSLISLLIVFSYFVYNDLVKRISIEPFGFEMGTRDLNFVISNAKHHRFREDNTISLIIPILKDRMYKKLNPDGFCIKNFGKKLLEKPSIYGLKIAPSPLSLPSPFKDNFFYEVKVHPIIGIYRITAFIRHKKPDDFKYTYQWKNFMIKEIGKEVLPILKSKYGRLHNLFFGDSTNEFLSIRNDKKYKTIEIVFTSYNVVNGVKIGYDWQFAGFLDYKQTNEWQKLSKCKDEIDKIKTQEKRIMEQKKVNEKLKIKKQKIDRKNQNKNSL